LIENEIEIVAENAIEISENEIAENTISNKKLDAAEEMLETLKALQLARKKYSPIWYNTKNTNEEKIKETEEDFRKIAASNDKILAAQNMEFKAEEIPQEQQINLINNETLEINIEKTEGNLEGIIKDDLIEIIEIENNKDIEKGVNESLPLNEVILKEEIEIINKNIITEEENIENINESQIEEINIQESKPSKIKEIIIKSNDDTHSFMEWLEILNTNITVSIIEKEQNEKQESIKEENQNIKSEPIEIKVTTKKPTKREIKPKNTPQITKVEIEKESIDQPISEKLPTSPSKNVIPNLDERILPSKGRIIRDKEVDKRAAESVSFNSALASETLAQLYERQGKKIKAIEIYKILIVKNPKKKRFFASQIKKLESE
jgi:hypothetical protein